MLWIVYNLLFPLVFLLMLPKFIMRMRKRGGYGEHFGQRIGLFDEETRTNLNTHPRIWIHAVSVGEIYVALRFIAAYRKANPETFFALSCTTSTGHTIAQNEMHADDVLFYFPVDLPPIINKVLRIVNPTRVILVEAEFWPNLIRLAHRQNIPIALINGRISESSYRGYMKIRTLTADILQCICPIIMQSEDDTKRITDMGAHSNDVHTFGTVKFDVAERNSYGEQIAEKVLQQIEANKSIVLLGGSTWPGEEKALCEVYKRLREKHPNLFLIITPRHVERADEIVQEFEAQNLSFIRRRLLGNETYKRPDVLFVDTTGELKNFYSVADIIFVGKSLCEHGGQNPIEPAMYGKAVVVGPNMENFPAVVPLFTEEDAIVQVSDIDELEKRIDDLLSNPDQREALGIRAENLVESKRGVIRRTVELLSQVDE